MDEMMLIGCPPHPTHPKKDTEYENWRNVQEK